MPNQWLLPDGPALRSGTPQSRALWPQGSRVKLKVCFTIFVFFLLVNLVESVLETGRSVLQERMEKEIRVSVLGQEPWNLETWEFMSKEQLSNLMKNDDFLKKFSSAKKEAQDKYQWYFIAISVVQILSMLLLALGCGKLVIGIVRRNEQP